MPRTPALLLVVLAIILTPSAVMAQAETSNAVPIDPQLRADILHLLQMTHSIARAETGIRTAFALMRPHLAAALPETPNRDKILADYGDRLAALPESPGFTDGLVAIYAKYFSDDDIKALAQFYATPAGQRFNEHSNDIAIDSMTFGQQFAAANMGKVFAQICGDYPELQNKAQFCSASVAARQPAATNPK